MPACKHVDQIPNVHPRLAGRSATAIPARAKRIPVTLPLAIAAGGLLIYAGIRVAPAEADDSTEFVCAGVEGSRGAWFRHPNNKPKQQRAVMEHNHELDFVVSAADEAACGAIEQTGIFRLSAKDQRQIAAAILNPHAPTPP